MAPFHKRGRAVASPPRQDANKARRCAFLQRKAKRDAEYPVFLREFSKRNVLLQKFNDLCRREQFDNLDVGPVFLTRLMNKDRFRFVEAKVVSLHRLSNVDLLALGNSKRSVTSQHINLKP